MIHFVEGLGPVSKKINDCSGLVGIVSVLEDEINGGDESMGAGGTRQSKLTRVIVLGDLVKKTFNTICSFQDESFKSFREELSKGQVPEVAIGDWR